MTVSPKVRGVAGQVEEYLTEIEALFKPHCRITFLMRDPQNPECEMLLTRDDLDEVAKAIERAKVRPAVKG